MAQECAFSIKIRFATASDNVLLSEIGAQTFAETFAGQNTPKNMAHYLAESFSPEKQARELANPDSLFLIAEHEGQPTGYAQLKHGAAPGVITGRKPIEIARIYVSRPWIGKGVGARLMQACLDEAGQAKCDVIWLGVWERNPRAIGFYRNWGFQEVGTQVFQLGDDPQRDVVMARAVSLSAG